MIYKGIEWLYGDPNSLRRKMEDYGSIVLAFLSLKKVASTCCQPNDVKKKKALCVEQVELTRPIWLWFVQILMDRQRIL